MKLGNLVRMKHEPFPQTRPYGLGLVLSVDLSTRGYNCSVYFPDLRRTGFDGIKWVNWQSTLEVISE